MLSTRNTIYLKAAGQHEVDATWAAGGMQRLRAVMPHIFVVAVREVAYLELDIQMFAEAIGGRDVRN